MKNQVSDNYFDTLLKAIASKRELTGRCLVVGKDIDPDVIRTLWSNDLFVQFDDARYATITTLQQRLIRSSTDFLLIGKINEPLFDHLLPIVSRRKIDIIIPKNSLCEEQHINFATSLILANAYSNYHISQYPFQEYDFFYASFFSFGR